MIQPRLNYRSTHNTPNTNTFSFLFVQRAANLIQSYYNCKDEQADFKCRCYQHIWLLQHIQMKLLMLLHLCITSIPLNNLEMQ